MEIRKMNVNVGLSVRPSSKLGPYLCDYCGQWVWPTDETASFRIDVARNERPARQWDGHKLCVGMAFEAAQDLLQVGGSVEDDAGGARDHGGRGGDVA